MDDTKKIELSKAYKFDGAPTKTLTMREPTVADNLAANTHSGSNAEKELFIIGMLCMVKPEDLHQLTMRDYKKVQAAFADFTD